MLTVHYNDENTLARAGELQLTHGRVKTPVFMPVGTNAAVKAVSHTSLEDMGYRLILANTYHLYLRPGEHIIKDAGGLHGFSTWNRNILTDSGGFQVFSLAPFRKIRKDGVKFRSHIDGAYHVLTPEKVIDLQSNFRSDILMPLDVCTPPDYPYKKALSALIRTTEWAHKSYRHWKEHGYQGSKLFGIIQGNFFKDLRDRSLEEICGIDFPGIAIGGLSVGEPLYEFKHMLSHMAPNLPVEKPHYVMGIGTPDFILEAVENGIDMFDCVYPTRIARNGSAMTLKGILPLNKAPYKNQSGPIASDCACMACRRYERKYIHHLFKTGEILGPMLVTHHNLSFMYHFMEELRSSIVKGEFQCFKKDFLENYTSGRSNDDKK